MENLNIQKETMVKLEHCIKKEVKIGSKKPKNLQQQKYSTNKPKQKTFCVYFCFILFFWWKVSFCNKEKRNEYNNNLFFTKLTKKIVIMKSI